MQTIITKSVIAIVIVLISGINVLSQDNSPVVNRSKKPGSKNIQDQLFERSRTQENIQIKEELNIIDEMNRLKADQNHLNGEKILQLQKKLESINHRSVTKEADNSTLKFVSTEAMRNHLQNQTDAITMSEFFSSPFAIYSGDVNQDRYIDLTDINLIFNDAGNFVTGYVVTDLTGDNYVDLTDLTIAFNNSSSFVSVIRP